MTAGRARAASRLLVISEVALALALVTTAGLMVKSLLRLQSQELGVTQAPILTFGIGVPPSVASGNEAVARFQLEFLERLRALPGVTNASAISLLPIGATGTNGPVRRVDQLGDNEGVPVTEFRIVMDDYFGGSPWDAAQAYAKSSPLNFVTNAKTPTLILHGAVDPRVPVSQGYEMYHSLKRLGVEKKMVVYPRTEHGPREPKFLLDIMERHMAWVDSHLKPVVN